MKITLISLRTEGSPSKFINNGSRQGESQALGQISKPGSGRSFPRAWFCQGGGFLPYFQPGLEVLVMALSSTGVTEHLGPSRYGWEGMGNAHH